MNRAITGLIAVVLVLLPVSALAASSEDIEAARDRASSADLGSVNRSIISEAFLTAKIIGFDPEEVDRLKDDIRDLKQENEELRDMLAGGRAGASLNDDGTSSSLEDRISKLERMFAGLQDSLVLLLNMVSTVL
jgi:archaellum component FlaC